MYTVVKGSGCGTIVLALFKYRADAENYIKERMIENVSSDMLDFNKPGTLTIENDSYIECRSYVQDKISDEREMFAYCPFCGAKMDGGMEEND